MRLLAGERELEFVSVELRFEQTGLANLFAAKNNKTLAETLAAPKYANLSGEVYRRYPPEVLSEKLGSFLYRLKLHQDGFYLRFLHEHGDKIFCKFSISDPVYTKLRGLYCFTRANEVQYIGRSHDPFGKRLNYGYGHISPKNCYRDGQSTNCHINSLIAENPSELAFYACPLNDDTEINHFEKRLIKKLQPAWNIALKQCNA